MLPNTPSLEERLLKVLSLACLAVGLVLIATPAAAQQAAHESDPTQGRIYTVSAFEVNGRSFAVTASGRRAYADTEIMRARIEESEELRKALPGYPREPHVKIDMRMAF
jgi:hypothetical protein